MVWLHEGLGSVSLWRDVPAEVSRMTGLASLVYSRRGYGQSDPVDVPRPLTYMHDEGRQVLPRLLHAAGVGEAILVGHSDGGSIALVAAGSGALPPSRARGLVLLAPHVVCEELSVRSIAEAREAYLHNDLRARLARHHADVDGAFWGWNRAWLDPDFRHWDLREFLPGVRAPVLLIQGADDPYGTLAQLDLIEEGVAGPVRRLVVPGGHAPHRDARGETLAAIAAFANGLESR